nr:DNA-3-methyladenine glycosylase [Lacticaseibacillus camelliae]
MAARGLLGAVLKVGDCAGLVVETEAYLGVSDRAAHAFGGRRTKTNEALYGRPGRFTSTRCGSTAYSMWSRNQRRFRSVC